MNRFSITVAIQAPAELVWAVMIDGERWPEWTPTVTSIERLDSGPLAIGSKARIRQPKLPPAIWEITALDQGKEFTWITRSPGVIVTARHGVDPIVNGTLATLSLEFSGVFGSLVARLTHRLNERYLGLEAAGLKHRSEASSSM